MESTLPGIVLTSCTSGTTDCGDAGGTLVGPPLWLLIVIAIVVIAVVVTAIALVVRRIRRRRLRLPAAE